MKFFLITRSGLINFLFYSISIGIMIYLYRFSPEISLEDKRLLEGETKSNSDNSEFSYVHYFIQKNGKPCIYLQANKLLMKQSENSAHLVYPHGKMYNAQQKGGNYSADKGYVRLDTNDVYLQGNVFLYDDSSEVRSEEAQYRAGSDFFEAIGQVKSKTVAAKSKDKIFIDADKAITWPSQKITHYMGQVVGKIIRALPYEPGIDFKADKLKANVNISYIEMIGNVYVKRGNLEANSLRGEIFLENYNKKLKYYALYDDVKVVEHVALDKNGKEIRANKNNDYEYRYRNNSEKDIEGRKVAIDTSFREGSREKDRTESGRKVEDNINDQLEAKNNRSNENIENSENNESNFKMSSGVDNGNSVNNRNSVSEQKTFIERRAFSEKLEGIVKEQKIVLTGYPKLIQEKDVIKGNKITFFENSEIIVVDDSSSSFILKKR